MVIINEAQERLIADVARAKAVYDREIDDLERQLQEKRSAHKEPIREAVRKAKAAGIPDRQIHLKGLGMAQYGQMVNFLKTPAAKRQQAREFEADLFGQHTLIEPTPEVSALDWEFRGLDKQGKMWEAVGPDGTKYGINLLTAGKISVIKPNTDKPGEYAEWTPELIAAAKRHNDKWMTKEDYSALTSVEEDDDEEDD